MEVAELISRVIWMGTRLEEVAWMLVNQPARGFGLCALLVEARDVTPDRSALWPAVSVVRPIPVPVGTGLWQARQSAPLVLLITRK